VGAGRDAPRAEADPEEGVGAPGEEAGGKVQAALRVGLPLRLRSPDERRGLLAHLPTVSARAFSVALSHFAEWVGAGKDKKRVLLVLDQAGWHTGVEVGAPEGIELEFLPARSPELMPAERLWPLVNERVANRLFEDLDGLEEALAERCLALSEQPELIRGCTGYHWWPDAA